MVITWQRVDDTSVAPADANGTLPTSFRVERREDSGTDYTTIGTMANSSSHATGKIKLRDKSALPRVVYRYRLVVIYEGGENPQEYTLRDSKQKTIARGSYDYRLTAVSASDGITLRWRQAVYEAKHYEISRFLGSSYDGAAGIIAHDPAAKRLTFTDTAAVSGQTYTYYLTAVLADDTQADDTPQVTATKE